MFRVIFFVRFAIFLRDFLSSFLQEGFGNRDFCFCHGEAEEPPWPCCYRRLLPTGAQPENHSKTGFQKVPTSVLIPGNLLTYPATLTLHL